MITYKTPIACFCFKRLTHLKRTINSLKANKFCQNSSIYFFSDAHRKAEDILAVAQVRNYLRTVTGFSQVTIIEREVNLGLSRSIISGVSQVLASHNSVIVIEDDLELSPYFLTYMNEALDLYQDNPQVASIHGYTLPAQDSNLPDTFFLKGADCWGWGTWKRAWDTFEQDGKVLLDRLNKQKLIREFDWDGLVGNARMLKDQIAGKNDSWAIRWHASCFLNNMLTLHPGKSLVNNIGLDGTGEHCSPDSSLNSEVSFNKTNLNMGQLDIFNVKESQDALSVYKKFYSSRKKKKPFLMRALQWMKKKYGCSKKNI